MSARKMIARDPRRGLVVLNLALLGLLGVVVLGPRASALQPASPANRALGEYSLVGGDTTGGSSNAVYILDSVNQELIALRFNTGNPNAPLETIGYRDLRADAGARSGR